MDEQSIFLEALNRPPGAEREAWLSVMCGDDAPLRQRICALLRRHDEAGEFLEQPPADSDATIVPDAAADRQTISHTTDPAEHAGNESPVVISRAGHSVLRALEQTMGVPRVILRESTAAGIDPIVRPKSTQMPERNADSRYQLQGEIARGGMGAILKGRDIDLGRDLAIKVLLDEHKSKPEVVQRFIEEAQIGGQLQHPGIAPIYELGQFADQRPFFSMKLVKGETLAKLLADRVEPSEERTRLLSIFEQICQTMAYAHSRGVIHRDLKPANIMVGSFGEVQVMDWGLAKVLASGGLVDERKAHTRHKDLSVIQTLRSGSDTPGTFGSIGSQTQMGSVMGTPAYMPPEQALGEIDNLDERADVFGLGAILCEILTGKPPYVGDHATQIFRMACRAKLTECLERLDECGVDDELVALTKHCLEAEPKDRPRDAVVLAARISGYLESVEVRLHQTETEGAVQRERLQQQQRSARTLRRMLGVLGAVAVVAGVAFVVAAFASIRANTLRVEASQKATEALQNSIRAEESRRAAVAESLAAEEARKNMQETATQAAADRDQARRESYRNTSRLAEAMLRGDEESRFRVADILWQTTPDLRGWEWGYLMAQCPLEEWSLQTDSAGLLTAAATVDGRYLVAAGRTGTVSLWNLHSRQMVWQQTTGQIRKLCVDPQNRFIAAASGVDTQPQFRILDVATGAELYVCDEAGMSDVEFDATGQLLYALDNPGVLRCIATSTWDELASRTIDHLPEGLWPILSMTLFVDSAGTYLGVCNQYGTRSEPRFRFFDPHTLTTAMDPGGLSESVANVTSPSTPVFHSALGEITYSVTNEVWKKTTDGTRRLLVQFSDDVIDLAADPVTGNRLAATAAGDVQVVSPDGERSRIMHGSSIARLLTLPGGHFLTAGTDGLIKCWSQSAAEQLAFRTPASGITASAVFLQFAGDGHSLLCRTWDHHNFLYEMDSLNYRHFVFPERNQLRHDFPVIRPGTNEFVDGNGEGLLFFPLGSTGADSESTRSIRVDGVGGIRFSKSGEIAVVRVNTWSVQCFDLVSGRQFPIPDVVTGFGAIEISPTGHRAALRTAERLQVWDVETGQLLTTAELRNTEHLVRSPAFHPEGELIAFVESAADSPARLVLWDITQGRMHSSIPLPPGARSYQCAFSPDGSRLFLHTTDQRIRVFDWVMGRELISLSGARNLDMLAVSPDGLMVASAGFAPALVVERALPWQSETPRDAAFYHALDDLRQFTVRTAATSADQESGLLTMTNRGDQLVRVEMLSPSEEWQVLGTLPPGESETLPRTIPAGIQFRFVAPETSSVVDTFTTADVVVDDDESPIFVRSISRDINRTVADERVLGDVARRQNRIADAIVHDTRLIDLETQRVLKQPGSATLQGRLAAAFLNRLDLIEADKSGDRTALLQQAVSFWQQLMLKPGANSTGWQHLLRFQLRLVDLRISDSAAESRELIRTLLSFWDEQSVEHPLGGFAFAELCRRATAVDGDGGSQTLRDARLAGNSRVLTAFGDLSFAERNWLRAVSLYGQALQSDTSDPLLFQKRALAREQLRDWSAAADDWLQVAAVDQEAAGLLVTLVRQIADSGDQDLAAEVRSRARTQLETLLEQNPDNAALQLALADLILQGIPPAEWSPLIPREMQGTGGEVFLADHEHRIFVSGPLPERAEYTLTFQTDLRGITAIRLESIPDDRLPQGGAGRAPGIGNFHVAELTAFVQPSASDGPQAPVEFSWTIVDRQQHGAVTLSNMIDDNPQTFWDTFPEVQKPHWLVLGLASPVTIDEGQIVVKLDSGLTPWTMTSLGSFRLLATTADDPGALLAAAALTDPKEKLAAACRILGTQ